MISLKRRYGHLGAPNWAVVPSWARIVRSILQVEPWWEAEIGARALGNSYSPQIAVDPSDIVAFVVPARNEKIYTEWLIG